MSEHTHMSGNRIELPRLAYTVGEIAAMLGRTENAVRIAIRDEIIPAQRIAGRVMIPAGYVNDLREQLKN